jgi:hypothetical protein
MWISLRIREGVEIDAHRRTIRKLDHAYDVELANASTASEREKAEYRRHWETLLYYEQIAEIKTRRLLRKADRLDVPIDYATDDSPLWRRSSQFNSWCLTALGYSEVRKAIRQECKERREGAITWASLVIGIIGSLTGLLSVWLVARGLR